MESRKMVLMNLSAGEQWRHRHREQTCRHSGGKEGRANGERSIETCTLPYVKQPVGTCCMMQGAQPSAL